MTPRAASLLAAAVLAAAVLTRFWDLGSRGFHLDEAGHAYTAQMLSSGHGYHYDPVFHGPLLYHLEGFVFRLAGNGDFQARFVPAAFGVLLVALVFWTLKRHAGGSTALIAAVLLVVSPSLTYYSRFNNHDMLIAVFTVAMIAALFDYRGTGLMWFAAAAALALSTKLNAYFVIGTLALYAACRAAYGRARDRPLAILPYLRRNPGYVVMAGTLGLAIVALLALFTIAWYVQAQDQSVLRATVTTIRSTIVDGFAHWSTMHRTGRLGGPFHYYVPILLIYEPLALIGIIAALLFYMRRRLVFLAVVSALMAAEWIAFREVPVLSRVLLNDYFQAWHVLAASACGMAGAWTVVGLWDEGREFLACWMFFGVMQFLLYSYANEKVPWLVVHVVLPWIVVVSAFLADVLLSKSRLALRSVVAAVVLVLLAASAHASWIVNTRNRSNLAEPLLQVDYAPAVRETVDRVKALAASNPEPAHATIETGVQWPFAWDLRGLPVIYRSGALTAQEASAVLVAADGQPDVGLDRRYSATRLPYFSWSWWIREVDKGDFRGLLRFMRYHDRWGVEDGTAFVVWVRKDLSRVR